MASHPNGPPPLFTSPNLSAPTAQAVAAKGTLPSLNLDDIFGDVLFTPDGDTVFASELTEEVLNSGEGEKVATQASKLRDDGSFVPVPKGGGLYTTQLHEGDKPALTMGAASEKVNATAPVPFQKAPQASHQLEYATIKKKRAPSDRKMSEQQKVERRYVN